jgi:WD40 repeat protein
MFFLRRQPFSLTGEQNNTTVQAATMLKPSRMPDPIATLLVDDSTITRLQIAKRFKNNAACVNSISFSDDGDLIVTSGDDDKISVFDALSVRACVVPAEPVSPFIL